MDERVTLFDYWIAIYSRRWAVGVVAGSACVFAFALSYVLPAVYEARASFYVPMESSGPPAGEGGAASATLLPVPEEKASGANLGILKSRSIARRVAELVPGATVDELRKNVDFVLGKEFLIEIYARDHDPGRAAALANAFARAYNEFHASALSQRNARRREALELQLATVNERLARTRDRLQEHQSQGNLLGAGYDRAKLTELTKNVEAEANITRADLAATRERIRKMEEQIREERATYRPGEAAITSPQIESLRQKISDLEIKLANELTYLAANHPTVVETREGLTAARDDLHKEVNRVIASESQRPGSTYESLRQQLIEQRAQEHYLQARLRALTLNLSENTNRRRDAGGALTALENLQQESDRLEELRLSIERNLEAVRSEEIVPLATIVSVERAQPPDKPAFPRPFLNAVVALVVGLAIGCYYALLLDYLTRIKRERVRRQMDRSLLRSEAS